MCFAIELQNNHAHLPVRRMGESESQGAVGRATNPPPRASWWHEQRGLLASGLHSPSRFPSGVLSGEPGREGQVPVTVAGPRRTSTGFRVSPFVLLQFSSVASLSVPAFDRKRRLE